MMILSWFLWSSFSLASSLAPSLAFSVPSGESFESVTPWEYIRMSAEQDEQERKLEAVSYLVGGATSVVLPFVATHSGSPVRSVMTYLLVPAGIYSIIYSGIAFLSESSGLKLKKRVEALSGPDDHSQQWILRRERFAEEILVEQAMRARFWRYFWAGLETGAGLALVAIDQSAPALISAGVLGGMGLYHGLYPRPVERFLESRNHPEVGFRARGPLYFAYSLSF